MEMSKELKIKLKRRRRLSKYLICALPEQKTDLYTLDGWKKDNDIVQAEDEVNFSLVSVSFGNILHVICVVIILRTTHFYLRNNLSLLIIPSFCLSYPKLPVEYTGMNNSLLAVVNIQSLLSPCLSIDQLSVMIMITIMIISLIYLIFISAFCWISHQLIIGLILKYLVARHLHPPCEKSSQHWNENKKQTQD